MWFRILNFQIDVRRSGLPFRATCLLPVVLGVLALLGSPAALADDCIDHFTSKIPDGWKPFQIADINDPDLLSVLKIASPNAQKGWIHPSLQAMLTVGPTFLHEKSVKGLSSEAFLAEVNAVVDSTKAAYPKDAEFKGSVDQIRAGLFRATMTALYTDQPTGKTQFDFRALYFLTPSCRIDVYYNEGLTSDSPVHFELIQTAINEFEKLIWRNQDFGIDFDSFPWWTRLLVFALLAIALIFFVKKLPLGSNPVPSFPGRKAIIFIYFILGISMSVFAAYFCEKEGLCRNGPATNYFATLGLVCVTLPLFILAFFTGPRLHFFFWAYASLIILDGIYGIITSGRPTAIGLIASLVLLVMCIMTLKRIFGCSQSDNKSQTIEGVPSEDS